MVRISCVYVAVVLGVLSSSDLQAAERPQIRIPQDSYEPHPVNEFGFELFRRLYAEREADQANVFISPISVFLSLGMLLNATDGETFDAISEILRLTVPGPAEANDSFEELVDLVTRLDPSVELRLPNSAWLERDAPVGSDYLDRLRETFGVFGETVGFQAPGAADLINDWVYETTGGRLSSLVTPRELNMMVALLVNTVSFQGEWSTPFDARETVLTEFRRPDGTMLRVPMMRQSLDAQVGGGDFGDDFVLVDLPYGAGVFSMTVVVPIEQATLSSLVEQMDAERWYQLVGRLRGEERTEVRLPRFALTYERVLNDVLKEMGMEIAFDAGRADFGRLAPGEGPGSGPHMGGMKQKSFVRVDERGTRTAAATGTAYAVSETPSLMADRPFLFAIRERISGTILFLGTVTDPTGQ